MFTKILLPVDISDFELSVGIIPYVSLLANKLGIPVLVASVINPDDIDIPSEATDQKAETEGEGIPTASLPGNIAPIVGPDKPVAHQHPSVHQETNEHTAQIVENAEYEVKRQLNRIVSRLTEEGVNADSITLVGDNPGEEILNSAQLFNCDLIAMATNDRNLLGQALEGSVTNEVARSAEVPVLAISPNDDKEFVPEQAVSISRIIAPLDGSEFSESSLPYVEHLAREMSLSIDIVRAISMTDVYPVTAGSVDPVVTQTPEMTEELYNAAKDEAIHYLQDISASTAERTGVPVNWDMLVGTPGDAIAELLEKQPDSIIALASHGRSGIKRWVMGSVAEELLRGTSVPVLIIPPAIANETSDE